jgi:hypothetical protein
MFLSLVCKLGEGDANEYQTILEISTQANTQGLQGHKD